MLVTSKHVWKRWVSHPQRLPVRAAIYELHKWLGLALGIYILAMAGSGLVLLFYPELYKALQPAPKIDVTAPLLTKTELTAAALRAYPGGRVSWIWEGATRASPAAVCLSVGEVHGKRLFDPATGADIGSSSPLQLRVLSSVRSFHVNLLVGDGGKTFQAIAGFLTAALCLTGAIVWWPGASRWTRHLRIRAASNPSRKVWETHSAAGFWTCGAVFLIALSGSLLVFQDSELLGSNWTKQVYKLHTGFYLEGWPKALVLVVLAGACLTLVVTGATMFWNRALRSRPRPHLASPAILQVRRLQLDRKLASLSPRHR